MREEPSQHYRPRMPRVALVLKPRMRIGITMDSAVDMFQMFDDDQSGTIEYDEFLRHIFPEEYVKAGAL